VDATPHLVVGAALGQRVHPVLAAGLGVASHIVLDAVPHYNYTGWARFSPIMLADVAFGFVLALLVAVRAPTPWGAVAGAAGAILPEVERVLWGRPHDIFRMLGIPHQDAGLPWGIVTQIAVTVVALAFALGIPHRRRVPIEGGE
jgi:hypothetical protein